MKKNISSQPTKERERSDFPDFPSLPERIPINSVKAVKISNLTSNFFFKLIFPPINFPTSRSKLAMTIKGANRGFYERWWIRFFQMCTEFSPLRCTKWSKLSISLFSLFLYDFHTNKHTESERKASQWWREENEEEEVI